NERTYRRGAETHHLPLLSLFSASNHLPDDDALRALFDRFLLRCQVDNLPREATLRLLEAGSALEQPGIPDAPVSAADPRLRARAPRARGRKLDAAGLGPVREPSPDATRKTRAPGAASSARRAVKAQKLLAASALLCSRAVARPSDLWVLRYVWDRAEQIGPLRGLVHALLEQQPGGEPAHPLAALPEAADGEEIARGLDAVARELEEAGDGRP